MHRCRGVVRASRACKLGARVGYVGLRQALSAHGSQSSEDTLLLRT